MALLEWREQEARRLQIKGRGRTLADPEFKANNHLKQLVLARDRYTHDAQEWDETEASLCGQVALSMGVLSPP